MNPFGDDDEDFEISDILNYNLDVSYRLVLMENPTFPEDMSPPTFNLKPMGGYEDDNLSEFIGSVSEELKNTIYTNEDSE